MSLHRPGFREGSDVYFVDRIKDTIRRRGENISSFEVELWVLEHGDVTECAAIAVPSDYTEDEVKVCVVVRVGAAITHKGLIDFLVPRMPAFMVPRYVEFVDELPKTAATLRNPEGEAARRRAERPYLGPGAGGGRGGTGGSALSTAVVDITTPSSLAPRIRGRRGDPTCGARESRLPPRDAHEPSPLCRTARTVVQSLPLHAKARRVERALRTDSAHAVLLPSARGG
jgi:hypothetical protein